MGARSGTPFPRSTDRIPVALAVAAIILSALAAYHNALNAPFEFDDIPSITENASLRSLWPPLAALSPPASGTSVGGRPVANLTLALNYALGGTGVRGYHATNVVILVLGGLVLFGIVRRTLSSPVLGGRFARDAVPLALAVALLWALHPLQTESVTYVVQRVESLMGLFYLLTLYCVIRSAGSPRPAAWGGFAVAACLLGMGTKEVMATAPLIVLLYDRTFLARSFRGALAKRGWLHLALAATWIPLAFLVAGTGWSRGGTAGFGGVAPPGPYWLAQFGAVARYLGLSLWPHPLSFDYGTVLLRHPRESALCALLVVPLAAAAAAALWRRPAAGFLGAWFFLILLPTCLVPVATQTMAEHRMYLPLAAVVSAVVLGGYAAAGRRVLAPLAAAVVLLGMLTALRNGDYRSEVALWAGTVATQPENARAHCALGTLLGSLPGRRGEGVAELEAALGIEPRYPLAENSLAVILEDEPGRLPEAEAHLRRAVEIDPSYAIAHYNLGALLARSGRVGEGIAELESALRLKPDFAEASSNLGVALCVTGRTAEGMARMEAALGMDPGLAMTHFNLGKAMESAGRVPEAIHQYEEAVRLQPGLAEAENNLGLLLCSAGRAPEGIEHIRAAIRANPGYGRAHLALGTVLLREGRTRDAAAEFEEAHRLNPADPSARAMAERLAK